jgi:hypothetical protein
MGIDIGMIALIYVIGVVVSFMVLALVELCTSRFHENMVVACAAGWPISVPLLVVVLITYILKSTWTLLKDVLDD